MDRVLIVSPCMGAFGGLESFVLSLAGAVAESGTVDVEVIFKKTRCFTLKEDLAERVDGMKCRVEFAGRGGRALWQAIQGADVVHLQNPCPDVVAMARLAGKPLLVQVINHFRRRGGLHERLWKLSLRMAHRRFFISDFVRRTWENAEVPLPGSRVVFPMCDLSSLEPLPESERKGFVFISRWIENKGLDTLIEAYARAGIDTEAWPLQLMGDGPLRDRIKNRVSELGLKNVEMPGFVSELEKGERIRRSKFAVIPPNTREDFGLVAVEARHLGVPCIVTRDGGLPEAAGRHSLICEPGDVEGLAALLKKATIMNSQEYASLARMTRESLPEELVGPSFYAKIYNEMARGSRTSVARG